MKTSYVFIIENQKVNAYKKIDSFWQNYLINGEESNYINDENEFSKILDRLNDDINLNDNLLSCSIVILYAKDQINFLFDLSNKLLQLSCKEWQVLSWESVKQRSKFIRLPKSQEELKDQEWILNITLPTLESLLNEPSQELDQELLQVKSDYEETMETLKKDKLMLEQELLRIKDQIKSIQLPNIEKLLVYLPIIYHNFWTSITPQDLSLLVGTYQIPEIPSPFPEPDSETIAIMKKRLQNLPIDDFNKIKNFCNELTCRNLKIRSEMRFLLEE